MTSIPDIVVNKEHSMNGVDDGLNALLERFTQDDLSLRIELLDADNRASNRLTHQFLIEFCDEAGQIDWIRLT